MSVFYNMETFILPRGLLMMQSGSLTFQKTHIFHSSSYIFELVLLLVVLLCGVFVYIYANIKKPAKQSKTSTKLKKLAASPSKPAPKVKPVVKPNTEKSSAKVNSSPPPSTATSPHKKRSSTSVCSVQTVSGGSSPMKKRAFSRLAFPHHPRLKHGIHKADEGEKNSSAERDADSLAKKENDPVSDNTKPQPKKPADPDTMAAARNPRTSRRNGRGKKKTVKLQCASESTCLKYPAPNYSYLEMGYIQILLYYTIPMSLLPRLGFPFLYRTDPNFGVFFNTTQHLTPAEFEENLQMYFSNKEVQRSRQCCRCKKSFFQETDSCVYHFGKLTSTFGTKRAYTCCGLDIDDPGCRQAQGHVWNGLVPGVNGPIGGFVLPKPETEFSSKAHAVVALDCEMCFTVQGLELTRVTLLNLRGELIYDSLVMPENPIIDYNTTFSGITKEMMEEPGVTKTLAQVQTDILQLIHANTIVIGHGLENDLRALKVIHTILIDTSILFCERTKNGFLKRHSLKNLMKWYLHKDVQRDTAGHDSVEDAAACLDLVKFAVDTGWPGVGFL